MGGNKMEVMDAIKTRYSVRNYAKKAIEPEKIEQIRSNLLQGRAFSFCISPDLQKHHDPVTEHGEQNHDCEIIREEEHSRFAVIEKGKGQFQK